MKIEEFTRLAEQVCAIDGRRPERLDEVHRRIRSARRRRGAGAAIGATALTAGALAIASLVSGPSQHSAPPVDQPSSSVNPTDGSPEHLPALATSPLMPGTYQFSVVTGPGSPSAAALIDVPNGFNGGSDWYVVSPDEKQFLALWTVSAVDRDACRHGMSDTFDPGPTVQDLADALIAQKSTRATAPEPVTLAGFDGVYIEVTSPRDLRTCDHAAGLWRLPGERGIYSDGQVDRLWILDVDGQRIVVNAAYSEPNSSASDLDKLTSMVNSVEFVAAES